MTTQHTVEPSEAYFQSLLRSPTLAVPTTLIFVVALFGIIATWRYALAGDIEMWQGSIINGFLSYWMFSIIHDSAHRSLSKNKFLNEGIGGVGLLFLFPYAPMSLLRWVHNQHHIHANGPDDPDIFEHEAPWWQVPIRWTFFDAYYIYYFFKNGGKIMKRHAKSLIIFYSLVIPAATAAIVLGYGYEILMLWFIPTRIALFLIAVVFVILPHHPAIVSQEDDPYMATTMRMGWEWLLTPLLVYQNYHLIHHLYPTIPFYKMHKVWYLKYDELNKQNISIQKPFALAPANLESHKEFYKNQTA